MRRVRSRLHTMEMLESRCVLAALFPAYVDGVFTLGDPFAEFPYGEENTLLLESRPSSTKTIFIDFDGHRSVNNRWGHDITFPSFDLDGSPEFSTEELLEMQLVFQNVAEDFMPFDVNVTTKDPGVAALTKSSFQDAEYGLRVIATQPTGGFGGGTGGIALLDIFDDSDDTPVFSFNKGANVGGMTVSHEVGHGMGLRHDGLNGAQYHPGVGDAFDETSWGPIMGAPFSANVTQWSPGDYDGSTNLEDDLQVITSPQNGVRFRADDFGGSLANAQPLSLNGQLLGWGVIEERSDVDAFTFDWAGGDLELNVKAFGERPNLDVEVQLLNAQGTVLVTENPVDSPDARVQASLGAGQYTILVDGVGRDGRYSDYGSLGLYTIEGEEIAGDFVTDGQWTCEDVDLLVSRIVHQDSAMTILDDFDSYSAGGLDVDQTGGIWRFGNTGANPPATLADDGTTIVPLLDIGTDGSNQYLAGTSSHGRPAADPKPDAAAAYTSRDLGPATILDSTSRRIAFDVFVSSDDRTPVNIGFSTQPEIVLPVRWAGFIQIVPNQFDVAGSGPLGDGVADTFSISGRNGGVLVTELATGLAVNEWHTIELDIDSGSNDYDVYVGDQLIAEDFSFRSNANNGDIRSFGFAGLEHQDSASPVYTDNDGVRLDNLRYGDDDLSQFDLNEDGVVDQADLDSWLAAAGRVNLSTGNSYLYGDANLDGNVDVSDFAIWNANKFTEVNGWCSGDFNADGFVDVPDFGLWNANKFTSAGDLNQARTVHIRTPIAADELANALPLGHYDPDHNGHDDEHGHSTDVFDYVFVEQGSQEEEQGMDGEPRNSGVIDRIFAG